MNTRITEIFTNIDKTVLFVFVLSSIVFMHIFQPGHLLGNDQGLIIKKTELIKDQNDFYRILGLIENTGNMTFGEIYATATLLDENAIEVANYSNQVDVQPLNPYASSPFSILIYDKKNNDKIKDFTIDLNYNITDHKNKDFKIISTDSRLDFTGFYYISGKVQNIANSTSNSTTIIATTYDKDNKMIGVWKAQTEPYNIFPQSIASFTIPITDKTQSFKINNFTLYLTGS